MFGKRIELFTMFGFKVSIDLSWFIILVLITWSLAAGLFPLYYPNLGASTYWTMGLIGAFGLFASILLHEFSHSIVARKYGLTMKGITLFLFGGVSEMPDEPPSAKVEFLMAIVGPISSLFLALLFYGMFSLGQVAQWPNPVNGIFGYLGVINLILAIFNLVPAFPLDGGRVLRSAIWQGTGDLTKATRIASQIGGGFGILLFVVGIFRIFAGNFIGGLWWILIGMFIRAGANMAYQQVLIRKELKGEPVRNFMKTDPVSVPPGLSLRSFVEDYVYHYYFKMFPVVEDGKLVGCVSTQQVKEIDKSEWDRKTVGEVLDHCVPDNSISPNMDAMEALSRMRDGEKSRLMVVEGDKLVGMLTLKDIMHLLSLKSEMESPSGLRGPKPAPA